MVSVRANTKEAPVLFWLFTTAAGATSLSSLLTSGMLDGDDCLLVKQGASLEVDVDFTIDRMEVLGTVTVVPPAPGDTRLISANQIIVGRKGKDSGAFLADMSSNPQVPVALGISLDANPRDPCTEWTLDGTGALAQAGTVTDNRPGLLWVTENGQLSLVGADPGETWTHLQQTVSTQDTTMTVPAHLGWPDNPKVVVAPTDFKKGEAEVFALSSVMGQEETWSLGTAAKHEHYHDTHGNVTLSGEVGLLTRNISVRGQVAPPSTAPDCSESDRKHLAHLEFDGAEIAVEPNMGTAAAELAYIEVVNGGKFDQLGHYPVHFHHGGDQSESADAQQRLKMLRSQVRPRTASKDSVR